MSASAASSTVANLESRASTIKFEKFFHNDLYKWITEKCQELGIKDAEILDMSVDSTIFGQILAERLKAKRIDTALRKTTFAPDPAEKLIHVKHVELDPDNFSDLSKLGKYDIIILKECLHEVVKDMQPFFTAMKDCMKTDKSLFVVLTRPKNPPLPLPDLAMEQWRKMAPSREEIIEAANAAGFENHFYSAAFPIKITKPEWLSILKGRFITAVKCAEKCNDRQIKEFIDLKSSNFFEFEEKIFVIIMQPKKD